MHEAQLHEENCFLTLTYSSENLPAGGTLVKWHFQDFMKRLRSRISPRKVKFYHCGEYGERFNRPHYHACIFGFDFPDKELLRVVDGERLCTSELLESLWPHGFATVGSVTFDSAAYVARYCVKKVNGERAFHHYMRLDERTGELLPVDPEYATMSRGGRTGKGIGDGWFSKFHRDVFPRDEVITNGRVSKPPRYYDSRFEILDPDGFDRIKRRRLKRAMKHAADQTPDRLAVRERVFAAKTSLLKRGYENET